MKEYSREEQYVGVDFHKEWSVVTRMRKDGTRMRKDGTRIGKTERFASTREGLEELRDSCTAQDHVVVEATYHWALFADVFEDYDGELVLAHPLKNRLIAESRNKNDKVDSKVLADLLRTCCGQTFWRGHGLRRKRYARRENCYGIGAASCGYRRCSRTGCACFWPRPDRP